MKIKYITVFITSLSTYTKPKIVQVVVYIILFFYKYRKIILKRNITTQLFHALLFKREYTIRLQLNRIAIHAKIILQSQLLTAAQNAAHFRVDIRGKAD